MAPKGAGKLKLIIGCSCMAQSCQLYACRTVASCCSPSIQPCPLPAGKAPAKAKPAAAEGKGKGKGKVRD